MRLEEYWGVGPKTAALLESEIGVPAAVEAIESADIRTLTAAGLSRGRATRILRRAHGGEGMEVLATRDARAVYKDLLDLAAEYAVTLHAADRIRVLTPLRSREGMESRLDDVLSAVDSWTGLDEETRGAVLAAFDAYDSIEGGDPAAVEAALSLQETGVHEGVFSPVADLDAERLDEAAEALSALGGGTVGDGADRTLDRLRETLAAVEDMTGRLSEVLETIQSGARSADEFREAFAGYVTSETGVSRERLREAMSDDAPDATDFVERTLRRVADGLRTEVHEREREVREELEGTVETARDQIDAAVEAVDGIAFRISLARFALAFDLTRPEFVVDRETLAVANARNLTLAAADDQSVQPVTYAVGDHGLQGPPTGDSVAVLTGANSGGKTTLLETLCQVAILGSMGLPVPADAAEVSVVDAIVFHRRHASFNAGVLESTLRSIVPPLAAGDRTLMLVDEFEAITEPGSAADLLHGLVTLTVDQDALGVFVTHLAEDLEPLPPEGRVDGIFAEGLTRDLELRVDYQPRFGTVGRSTPEFIVSRLVADASDRNERAAFDALAQAVGQEVVQRTLEDARWSV